MSLIVELGSARAGSCEVRRPLTRALLEIFSVAFSEQLKVLHHYGVFFFFIWWLVYRMIIIFLIDRLILELVRPGSNAVLHMSRTQFNQLGSCEVRRLTQLRYQCTPKLTILPNFSYWYSQVHIIEFFQLPKVLRKKVSPRQSYKEKTILWINYLCLEAVNKLSWSIKVPLKVT